MKLFEVSKGMSFKVIKVTLGSEVGKRLVDMGFTKDATGKVIRHGILQGPMHIEIRNYDILIRRCEAAGIEVELITENENLNT